VKKLLQKSPALRTELATGRTPAATAAKHQHFLVQQTKDKNKRQLENFKFKQLVVFNYIVYLRIGNDSLI
jgi:hypothetical protein